ncbi:MAG TPA: DUF6457 domain-containing protein [Actinomycetota bacterium]|jgi:hypothetical protein|nr:DUF6457 domain-containing protein [Actinomycetota bacterium]
MADWLTQAATALGVDPIDDATQERLLGAARDVAHGVERKLTPLATFLLGTAVERRVGAGEDRAGAFEAAVADLERAIDADHDA